MTQFISFHGLWLLLAISWIFRSKNTCLVFLTIVLNCFQFSIYLKDLHLSRYLVYLLSYHLLECLIILTIFELLIQICSVVWARDKTVFSRNSIFEILFVLISLKALINSSTNFFSSLLFLTIVCFLVWTYSLRIGIITVREAWSKTSFHSEWMKYLSSSSGPYLKKKDLGL